MKIQEEVTADRERCPYCGQELEDGYIQSPSQIYFNRGSKARFFASGDLSSIRISSFGVPRAPYIKAAYCDRCQKLIVNLKK